MFYIFLKQLCTSLREAICYTVSQTTRARSEFCFIFGTAGMIFILSKFVRKKSALARTSWRWWPQPSYQTRYTTDKWTGYFVFFFGSNIVTVDLPLSYLIRLIRLFRQNCLQFYLKFSKHWFCKSYDLMSQSEHLEYFKQLRWVSKQKFHRIASH